MPTSSFIIQVKHGGLGDHLFFSHLPQIAKQHAGFDFVFISNQSDFRNSDIKKLVWDMNPYVDGFCDEGGQVLGALKPEKDKNLLDQIMLFYGMDDGKRFHEPEVYYKPKLIDNLVNSVVFDPNYISNIGMLSNKKLFNYMEKHQQVTHTMASRNKTVGHYKDSQVLEAKNIFEYCDIIYSCKNFLCMTSGGATLASALNIKATVFYGHGQNKIHRHSPLHSYVDLTMLGGRFLWFFLRLLRFSRNKVFKF